MVIIHNKLPAQHQNQLHSRFPAIQFLQISAELEAALTRLLHVRPDLNQQKSQFYALDAIRLGDYRRLLFCDSDLLFRDSIEPLFQLKQPLIGGGDGIYYRGGARTRDGFAEHHQADCSTQLINTHLFIICPNNSGSTFLKNVLATSKYTWNLKKEGQYTFGFAGPSTPNVAGLIWSTRPEWLERLTDETAYNWAVTRKAWYFCALSHNPKAHIFVTKAPPFLFNVHLLQPNFYNPKFIFIVRNPYPVIEGIYRHRRGFEMHKHDNLRVIATNHVINCLAQQRKNIERYAAENLSHNHTIPRRPDLLGSWRNLLRSPYLALWEQIPPRAIYCRLCVNVVN